MRLGKISKIFKVSSKSVSTKRVTSKKKMACMCDLRTFLGQTHAIRVQKWSSYGPHSTMILFHVSWTRLIASTLIFVWVIRYSHLSCSKSLLRTGSSSSRKDRLLHEIRGIAKLGLRRLSRKYQGHSRVSEHSEGHVLKSFLLVVCCRHQGSRHAAWTAPLNSKNTTMHKTIVWQSRHWQSL